MDRSTAAKILRKPSSTPEEKKEAARILGKNDGVFLRKKINYLEAARTNNWVKADGKTMNAYLKRIAKLLLQIDELEEEVELLKNEATRNRFLGTTRRS